MKRLINSLSILLLGLLLLIAGCSRNATSGSTFDPSNFADVLKNAQGTTVNFYGWGGNERTNKWVKTEVAKYVKDNYGITLKWVPMDIDAILNKMLGEKQAGSQSSSIDLVWINGENFYTAMQNKLLYGPFTQYLPSYQKYVDKNADDINFDFGYKTNGYEAPYGKAVFVLINDAAVTSETPKSAQELLEFAKKYPGKVTYPAPPDFIGSAFVRNIIYEIVGYDKLKNIGSDKEKIKETIQPAMDYLKELKPYLWQEGKTYPATSAQLDNMFADGEAAITMSYEPNSVAAMIAAGRFKDTARSYIFDRGMIGNTNFVAIPANASNKNGALAVVNAILSPEMQASKYDPANWGSLPVLDNAKLTASEKELFTEIPLGKGVISQNELLQKRLPEMPAEVIPIIEQIWQKEIPNK